MKRNVFASESLPDVSQPIAIGDSSDLTEGDFDSEIQPDGLVQRRSGRRELWSRLVDPGRDLDAKGGSGRQNRNINLTLLFMLAFGGLLGIVAWVEGQLPVAVGAATVVALAGLNMAAFRRMRTPTLSAHLTVANLYLAVLAFNLYSGGFADASSSWFVTIPLLAGVLIGLRAGWVWTGVVAVTGLGSWLLTQSGFELVNRIPNDMWLTNALTHRLALLVGVGLLLTLFLAGQRRAEREIRGLAFSDPLTGLKNRKSFGDTMAEALETAEREQECLALLFIDLDRFKEYNDTLGHGAGDEILRWVAEILKAQVRAGDLVAKAERTPVSISRLGGDEFTVVLGNIGSKQRAAQAAKRLLDALCAPVTIGGVEIFVSASIGVAVFPEDGRDVETLLRRADAGMYSAKKRGGNSFEFFAPWMNEASLRRIFVENRLRRATTRNEISVRYQPIFEARNHRIVAAEVLARWQSPSMGAVSPGEFIPIAEDAAPLIVDIGNWVLTEALTQLGAWHRSDLPPIRMSVNFAAAQLRQLRSFETINRILSEADLESRYLELEVTERIALSSDEPAMEELRRLRRHGVGVALDDFGTGSASLSYMRQLPLTRVKIDRSFVSAVSSDPREAHFTSAIVAMAKSLGLAVVAEGVESEAQADFLRTVGCDELQGYLFSRPVTAEEFTELLRRDAARDRSSTSPVGLKHSTG